MRRNFIDFLGVCVGGGGGGCYAVGLTSDEDYKTELLELKHCS